jgi:hypothetical protein
MNLRAIGRNSVGVEMGYEAGFLDGVAMGRRVSSVMAATPHVATPHVAVDATPDAYWSSRRTSGFGMLPQGPTPTTQIPMQPFTMPADVTGAKLRPDGPPIASLQQIPNAGMMHYNPFAVPGANYFPGPYPPPIHPAMAGMPPSHLPFPTAHPPAPPATAPGLSPFELEKLMNQHHRAGMPPQAAMLSTGGSQPAIPSTEGGITTLMLRNIPVKYNREMMLDDMDRRGFWGTYDFFYLPIDFQTGNTVGYAFINFLNSGEASRFRETYQGLSLSPDSTKICEVGVAKAQGKANNVEQYRNSSVMAMEERFKPVIFQNGARATFPPPTRSLKPVKPRMKQ